MDPFLNLLQFIYQEKKAILDIKSISDFDAGRCFPQFVSMIFNKKIPDLDPKPNSLKNFKKTLKFISESGYGYLIKRFNKLPTDNEKVAILLAIISKVYFNIDKNTIFNKSNSILKSIGVQYKTFNEIISGKFLLTLLSIFTDQKIRVPKIVNEKKDFKNLIIPSFQIANVPLVIDKNSFDVHSPDRFLIQLQIIFKIFSEKIDKIKSIEKFTNEQDRFYKEDDCYVNSVNYFILKSEIYDEDDLIEDLSELFKKGNEEKLFTFVQGVIGQELDLGYGDANEKFKNMISFLNNRYKNFDQKFKGFHNKDIKSEQKKFIEFLFSNSISNEENFNNLLTKCNSIFFDYQIEVKSFLNFTHSKLLLLLPLLQRLAFTQHGDFDLVAYPPQSDLTIFELHHICAKLKVPFILDNDALSGLNDDFIKLQIKIIIDQFDVEYITKIVNQYKKDQKSTQIRNSPLLLTINRIGSQKGIRFNTFESIIDGRFFPFFIECLLQASLDDHVEIIKSNRLTEEESDRNVQATIKYLRTLKNKFNILIFDFRDPQTRLQSVKLLCKNLINLFFLKKTKKEILERCDSIIGTKIPIKSADDFREDGFAFFALLHYLTNANINFNVKRDFGGLDFAKLEERFRNANVPIIINEELFNYEKETNESPIFYQLQFIFNELDRRAKFTKPSFVVVERLLKALKKLQNVKTLRSHIYTISSKAKNDSVKYNINSSIYLSDFKRQSHYEKGNPKSLDYGLKELRKLKNKEEERMANVESILNNGSDSIKYWNQSQNELAKDLKIDNGIFYKDQLLQAENSAYFDNCQAKLIEDLKNVKAHKINFPTKAKDEKEDLYKIFIYNEERQKWEFNINEFNRFGNDKGIYTNIIANTAVRLILFLNTKESDLITLNSKFLRGKYPNINDNQIFVYALTHDNDGCTCHVTNVFLFLHVPPNPQVDNITLIVSQIYSFLYSISNDQIILLNENISRKSSLVNIALTDIEKKISAINVIYDISKSLNIRTNIDSSLIFLVDHDISLYDHKISEKLTKEGKFASLLKAKLPTLRIVPIDFRTNFNFFNDMLEDLPLNSQYLMSELSSILMNFPHYEISNLYLKIKAQPSTYHLKILERIIIDRFNKLKLIFTDAIDAYKNLLDEFAFFTPKNDNEITEIYRLIIYPNLKEKSRETLTKKLEEFSESQIKILKQIINKKIYWEPEQISVIQNSYFLFQKEAFYNYIIISRFGRIADLIYNDYGAQILKNQEKEDRLKIRTLFNSFSEKIEKRQMEKERDMKNDLIKSTNYIMKESEIIKDQEIIVGVNQSLEDVIEQDF